MIALLFGMYTTKRSVLGQAKNIVHQYIASLGILSKAYYLACNPTSLAGTVDSACSVTSTTLARHTLTKLFYATSLTLASRLTVVSLFLAGHALCRDTETLVHITGRRS